MNGWQILLSFWKYYFFLAIPLLFEDIWEKNKESMKTKREVLNTHAHTQKSVKAQLQHTQLWSPGDVNVLK